MAYFIDMHNHTSLGSFDSLIPPQALVERMVQAGLDGAVVTEHTVAWPDERVTRLRNESGLFVVAAREWETEFGHILVLGANSIRQARSAYELRQAVLAVGGLMILAHPFRFFPGANNLLFGDVPNAGGLTAEQLAEHPVFALVDEIEVLNNWCLERENRLALEVARVLGMRGVGGSDSHHVDEIGRCVTVFQRPLKTDDDLLQELRARRFHAARRQPDGQYVPFDDIVLEGRSV